MTETLSHKERTRARILDEAAQALREHGVDGISVAALMKRAGLTHGGFYAHFENRDDLVAHAVDRMFQDNRAMLARHLDPYLAPDRDRADLAMGLAALIDDYLSERRIDTIGKGCPFPALLGEVRRMPAAARARFAQGMEAFQRRMEAALQRLGHDQPAQLAASALAELIGAATAARALGRSDTALAILEASRIQIKHRLGLNPPATPYSSSPIY